MNEIKLFPLSSVVLPKGKMNLRIFEPRYKRLISECSQRGEGFGVCLVNEDISTSPASISSAGTLANIIDFELLPDGLLGVTIEGSDRFTIKHVWNEYDGLRCAQVEMLDEWQPSALESHNSYLREQLQRVYRDFPQIQQLYPSPEFHDATWIAQRWLELLPLRATVFDQLVLHPDCTQALHFLSQAIEPSQD
jgi:Lon protease-like protein